MSGLFIAFIGGAIFYLNVLRVASPGFLDDHWTWRAAWLIVTSLAIQTWSVILIFVGAYHWSQGLPI